MFCVRPVPKSEVTVLVLPNAACAGGAITRLRACAHQGSPEVVLVAVRGVDLAVERLFDELTNEDLDELLRFLGRDANLGSLGVDPALHVLEPDALVPELLLQEENCKLSLTFLGHCHTNLL